MIEIDDKKINIPPYNEILILWKKAEALGIPKYKDMTKDELIKAIKARQE